MFLKNLRFEKYPYFPLFQMEVRVFVQTLFSLNTAFFPGDVSPWPFGSFQVREVTFEGTSYLEASPKHSTEYNLLPP